MGQALYRTHRPLKLSEVIGQEHVTTALAHALKAGTISHAYLFTGPRGVGKTTIARILAHEINGLSYTDNSLHLDIIEIDAASNRRIDEIRDLRDKVHTAPTSATYKVYIIDEVHMLTREAFNALLKTLEEPPAHVVFILATTEAHKLPETIISRTQRYAFKPVALPSVAAHLQHIADEEKIQIEPAALELIAAHGEGSFRDSISLLDQVRNSGKKVTLSTVQHSLGIAPAELVEQLLTALANHQAAAVVAALQQAREQGYEAAHLAKQLGGQLREGLLAGKVTLAPDTAMRLLEKLITVPTSFDPVTYLEIILLEAALSGPQTPPEAPVKKSAQAVAQNPSIQAAVVSKQQPTKAAPQSAPPNPSQAVLDPNIWPHVLATIKQNFNTLYGILRACQVEFQPGLIRLSFSHAFHQKRAADSQNRQIIAQTIQDLTGQTIHIEYHLAETLPKPQPAPQKEPQPRPPKSSPQPNNTSEKTIETISNIFGKAEVLES